MSIDNARADADLNNLRREGFTIEGEKEPFLIEGNFLFWPSTQYWRRRHGRRAGYGWRSLAAAIRAKQENDRRAAAAPSE